MTEYDSFESQAAEAYQRGRYQEAALFHEQALRIARDQSMTVEAFSTGLRLATSWKLAGYPLRALAILTELFSALPNNVAHSDLWSGRVQLFRIGCAHKPEIEALRKQLDQLCSMHTQAGTGSDSDVHYLAGCLYESQGDWSTAIVEFERALSGRRSLNRLMIFQIVAQAVRVCLRLAQRVEAGRFCELLGQTEAYFDESRVAHTEAQLRLACWDGDLSAIDRYLSRLTDFVYALQRPTWSRQLLHWQVRAALLRQDLGDPLSLSHPARALMTTRMRGAWEAPDRYARSLLRIDYRLACLRFALGLTPHEDLFDHALSDLPSQPSIAMLSPHEIQHRVNLIRRALQAGTRYAAFLDQCFDCTWRQEEVKGRWARLASLSTNQAPFLCPTAP
jgi:tetratricopeptide (TPR) repeat protein